MTAVLCWAGDTCFSSAGQGVSPIVFPVPGDTVFFPFPQTTVLLSVRSGLFFYMERPF